MVEKDENKVAESSEEQQPPPQQKEAEEKEIEEEDNEEEIEMFPIFIRSPSGAMTEIQVCKKENENGGKETQKFLLFLFCF